MLLRRGADALKEDGERCIPSFLARKNQELECRQIMSQHLTERTERICRDTVAVRYTLAKSCGKLYLPVFL